MEQRINYLENLHGESTGKHSKEISGIHRKLADLNAAVSSLVLAQDGSRFELNVGASSAQCALDMMY